MIHHYMTTRHGAKDILNGDTHTSGQCVPVPDGWEWHAEIEGWHAKAPTEHGAAMLAMMAWLDALPPELADSPRIWFTG